MGRVLLGVVPTTQLHGGGLFVPQNFLEMTKDLGEDGVDDSAKEEEEDPERDLEEL